MSDVKTILTEQPGLGRIYLCQCNSIHVTIGPVTVALSAEAFGKFAAMIDNAMDQICSASPDDQIRTLSLADAHLPNRFSN